MRLLSEMNNGGELLLAPRRERSLARPRLQHDAFKQAWRRAAIILRGGEVADMNRRLKRLHLPKVKTGAEQLPVAPVSLVWVPLSFGNPETEYNHPKHFWPGAGYVDWVGTTWYSPHPNEGAMDELLQLPEVAAQPFTFAEWGVWGAESPGLRGQVLRLPEVAPARADGRVLPVGQPQARVPALDPSALARGAAPAVAGRACSGWRPSSAAKPLPASLEPRAGMRSQVPGARGGTRRS